MNTGIKAGNMRVGLSDTSSLVFDVGPETSCKYIIVYSTSSIRGSLKVNPSPGTPRPNCTLFCFNLTAPAAFLVKSTVHYWDPFYEGAVRCNLMNLWHKAPFHCRAKNRGYLDPVGLYVKGSP